MSTSVMQIVCRMQSDSAASHKLDVLTETETAGLVVLSDCRDSAARRGRTRVRQALWSPDRLPRDVVLDGASDFSRYRRSFSPRRESVRKRHSGFQYPQSRELSTAHESWTGKRRDGPQSWHQTPGVNRPLG